MAITDNRNNPGHAPEAQPSTSTEAATEPEAATREAGTPSFSEQLVPDLNALTPEPAVDQSTDALPSDPQPDALAQNMLDVAGKRTAGGEVPPSPWIANTPDRNSTTIDPATGQVMTYGELLDKQAAEHEADRSHD